MIEFITDPITNEKKVVLCNFKSGFSNEILVVLLKRKKVGEINRKYS